MMNTTLRNFIPVGSNSVAPEGSEPIPNNVRIRLIGAHEAGLSYKEMSQLFGVKVDTADMICSKKKYQAKKRSGSRGKKLNDTHVKGESRPGITLNGLN